jgi:hypothetical protein
MVVTEKRRLPAEKQIIIFPENNNPALHPEGENQGDFRTTEREMTINNDMIKTGFIPRRSSHGFIRAMNAHSSKNTAASASA